MASKAATAVAEPLSPVELKRQADERVRARKREWPRDYLEYPSGRPGDPVKAEVDGPGYSPTTLDEWADLKIANCPAGGVPGVLIVLLDRLRDATDLAAAAREFVASCRKLSGWEAWHLRMALDGGVQPGPALEAQRLLAAIHSEWRAARLPVVMPVPPGPRFGREPLDVHTARPSVEHYEGLGVPAGMRVA